MGKQETNEKIDYLFFMNWFQNTHPDIYILHWQAITMANNGSGITAGGGNSDKITREMLTGLLVKYYAEINS